MTEPIEVYVGLAYFVANIALTIWAVVHLFNKGVNAEPTLGMSRRRRQAQYLVGALLAICFGPAVGLLIAAIVLAAVLMMHLIFVWPMHLMDRIAARRSNPKQDQ